MKKNPAGDLLTKLKENNVCVNICFVYIIVPVSSGKITDFSWASDN